jgi:hypothetical protein
MKLAKSKLVTIALTMTFSMPLFAGTVITMKITDGASGESGESKMFIQDKKMRVVGFDSNDGPEETSEAIVDANIAQMTIIHPDSKQ